MPTFYERFSEIAKEKGYTSPTAAGEAMGFRSGTISAWKVRQSVPQEYTLQKVADFFGVSKDWLAGKNVDKEGNPIKSEPEEYSSVFVPRISFGVPQYMEATLTSEKPTLEEFRDNVLRLALFGNNPDITSEDLQEIRDYAQLILAKKARKKGEK